MKTRQHYTITLLLVLMIMVTACSSAMNQPSITATPVPTNTVTPPPTDTPLPTATPTETVTPTPTSKFPAGPLRELEKSLGIEYALAISKSGNYYTAQDNNGNTIPDVKFFEDSTAELTYEHRGIKHTLVIAFQAIAAKDDGIEFGLWKYSNGEYNFETHPAPKDAIEPQSWRKLVILRGHPKEQAMIDTVFAARDMSLRTDNYNPKDEFKGIAVTYNFKTVDDFDVRPQAWEFVNWSRQFTHKPDGRGVEIVFRFIPIYPNNKVVVNDGGSQACARPMQVALGAGWYAIEIHNKDGTLQSPIVHVPIVAMNADRSIIYLSTLVRREHLERISPLLDKEDRGEMFIWLFRSLVKDTWIVTDPELMLFMTEVNRDFFDTVRVPKLGDGKTTGDQYWKLRQLPKELAHTFFSILAPKQPAK